MLTKKYIKSLSIKGENFVKRVKLQDGGEASYCGLVELHNDEHALGPTRSNMFVIEPIYWDDDAVFVTKLPNNVIARITKNYFLKSKCEYFAFDALCEHGLFTKSLFLPYLKDKKFKDSKAYKNFLKKCESGGDVKLIWKFVSEKISLSEVCWPEWWEYS